jgi:hypothetical protein
MPRCPARRLTVLRLLLGAALLVALAGCLKIDLALDIDENASIDGEIILAVSEELAQLTGQSREELIAQFEADVMRNAPEGVTKESYRTAGLEGTRLILDGFHTGGHPGDRLTVIAVLSLLRRRSSQPREPA